MVNGNVRLAEYRGHVDAGMAGYESDSDLRPREMVSPRHAMRADWMTPGQRLRHMTALELARLAVSAAALCAGFIALVWAAAALAVAVA